MSPTLVFVLTPPLGIGGVIYTKELNLPNKEKHLCSSGREEGEKRRRGDGEEKKRSGERRTERGKEDKEGEEGWRERRVKTVMG